MTHGSAPAPDVARNPWREQIPYSDRFAIRLRQPCDLALAFARLQQRGDRRPYVRLQGVQFLTPFAWKGVSVTSRRRATGRRPASLQALTGGGFSGGHRWRSLGSCRGQPHQCAPKIISPCSLLQPEH